MKKYAYFLVFSLIVANLLAVAWFMVRYHPYQNLYFNRLAGSNMDDIKKNYELDYWGLSYREGLEYIFKHDAREKIKVAVDHQPGWVNAQMLPRSDSKRLYYTLTASDADYIITNYRQHPEDYPYKNEYYSIKIGGAKILSVFDVRAPNASASDSKN